MTNEIIEGLAEAMQTILGEGAVYVADEQLQYLEPPCFIISEAGIVQTPFGRRKKKDRSYLVQYFPESETNPLEECRRIGEKLIDYLEFIKVGENLLPCTELEYSVDREQHVLNFKCNVNTFTWKTGRQEAMDKLTTEIKVEKEEQHGSKGRNEISKG